MHDARRLLTREQVLTIPNAMSAFRIVLIPFIIWTYAIDRHYLSVSLVVLSAISDMLDGFVARKLNMISDFGKFLDPVADKLTQAAMILCLVSLYPAMFALFLLMAVREFTQFFCGLAVLKKTDTMNSANWYGKVSTATVYVVMVILFLFPDIPAPAAWAMMALCAVVLAGSMILYIRFFYKILKAHKNQQ